MRYNIIISKENIIKIQQSNWKNLYIIVNQNGEMYHASIADPNGVLLQTEDIFNSKDIAENIMNQIIDAIIADHISIEFATVINYTLNQE